MAVTAKYKTDTAYDRYQTNELQEIIDALNLSDLRKRALRSRWLDSVTWMSRRARTSQNWYYGLRVTTIVGSILIPTSVTISRVSALGWFAWVGMALGILVAITSAMEEFFHFGDRWRHYRSTVEALKIEGWQFFQLTGPYSRRKSHADAFEKFAGRVEMVLIEDVTTYIKEIAAEKEEEHKEGEPSAQTDTEN